MSLDRVDRDILRILHAKGRLPVVELAKLVNLTTSLFRAGKTFRKRGIHSRLPRGSRSGKVRLGCAGLYPYSA